MCDGRRTLAAGWNGVKNLGVQGAQPPGVWPRFCAAVLGRRLGDRDGFVFGEVTRKCDGLPLVRFAKTDAIAFGGLEFVQHLKAPSERPRLLASVLPFAVGKNFLVEGFCFLPPRLQLFTGWFLVVALVVRSAAHDCSPLSKFSDATSAPAGGSGGFSWPGG